MHEERILPRDNLLADHELPTRRHAPSARTEGLVQDPAVLDLGEVDDAVGFDLHVLERNRLHQHGRDLGTERRSGKSVE